ncbi:TonB-dependent receptor [Opitutales bacterium ASA1]|uniref:TonB-dependent receptor n=1 Tax=Congregicoccus parvus TaxID=3081749 RepID=UPI002B2CE25E|nr:TonB-dependent receptor [Opitutales bacterium ASA1]
MNEEEIELEEFVVEGIRGSLAKAVEIKRANIQSVDVIVSEDIGKFPDNNVVEALQRLSGVQVTNRFRGEVAAVTIRGLGDVTTTVNGRNVFTAAGRQVALQDIPAALLNRVDVYKTRSSDLIESGIAGVIDVRTQRPFDFADRRVVLAARGIYQEQADTFGPNVSALISDRWELENGGEFGALFSLSYARTEYRDQSVTAGAQVPFMTDQPLAGWVPYQRIFPDIDPNTGLPFWQAGLDDGLPTAPGSTLSMFGQQVPYLLSRDAIFASDFMGDRKRPAANLSLQFAPSDRATYTFEAFYNGYRDKIFNDLHFAFVDWWGSLSANPSADIDLYPGTNIMKARRNVGFPYGFMSGDFTEAETDSYVFALGAEWKLTDRLKLAADLAYQNSEYKSAFFAVRTDRVHRSINVDFNSGGGLPAFSYGDDPATPNVDESDITNPALWNVAQMWDNGNYDEGDAKTLKLDAEYDLDVAGFKTLRFGGLYDVRGAESGSRTQNAGGLGMPLSEFPSEAVYVNKDFFDGRSDVPRSWAVFNGDYIPANKDEIRSLYNSRINAGLLLEDQLVMRETFDVTEKTTALYAMSDFEYRPENAGTIDGQIGFRYVKVKNDTVFTDQTTLTRTPGSSSHDKVLPSITVRYAITNDLRVRLSYCETLRPPGFNDLNPTINYVEDVTDIGYGTASGGNVNLRPTESKNYDLSIEYYFGRGNAIYGSVFKRDIEGLVVPFRRRVTAQTVARPNGYDYILSQPFNASDGELKGFELGMIYFPENLPGVLDGFGVQASFTSLDSEQNIPLTNNAGDVVGQRSGPFFAVSDESYNVTLAYEKGRLGARLGYVWRSGFLNNNEAALFANPLGVYRRPERSLDLQISWNLSENLSLTFDATNLTDELVAQSHYGNQPGNATTNNFGNVLIGRTFAAGVRWSF